MKKQKCIDIKWVFDKEDDQFTTTSQRLRERNKELERKLKGILSEKSKNEDYEAFIAQAGKHKCDAPAWMIKPTGKKYEAIPVACSSDWHFDEVVRPDEIDFMNAYNRDIAVGRLKRHTHQILWVAFDLVKGYTYPGLVYAMLGDMFSGIINEELQETNEDTILSSVLFWSDQMVASLKTLANEFKHIWVVCVPGNHGRMSKKPRAKLRAQDTFDWMLGQMVQRALQDDKRFSFAVTPSQKHRFQVYNTRFVASHGDEARGGHGIAAMLSPQLLAAHRMKQNIDFDYWLCGHWHFQGNYGLIRCNGAAKGYDEFAFIRQFKYQEPTQDLFFVAPEHNIIMSTPIFVMDSNEAWLKNKQKISSGINTVRI